VSALRGLCKSLEKHGSLWKQYFSVSIEDVCFILWSCFSIFQFIRFICYSSDDISACISQLQFIRVFKILISLFSVVLLTLFYCILQRFVVSI